MAAYLPEIWLDIPGFVGYYMASNTGRIKSLDRFVRRSKGGLQISKSRILKQNMSGQYLAVALCKNGIAKTYRVHRLVATAFLGVLPKDKVINHFDCNKLNNASYNLELTTQKNNIKHAVDNGHTKGYKKRSI